MLKAPASRLLAAAARSARTDHPLPRRLHPEPDVLAQALAAERQRFVQMHPESMRLAQEASANYLFGVPLHWMLDWPAPSALFMREARGAHVSCVDGIEYADFCLGDTAAMFGHSPPAIAETLAREATHGLSAMLPSADALIVGRGLERLFGLPVWQFATTATDANRFMLRWARAVTGRKTLVVFDGCYHGTVDDVFVDLDDGRPTTRPSLLGQAYDLTQYTRVVPFNDLAALRAALAAGDVAAVLAEPALTNCGMVLPDADFWPQAQALVRDAGALLILDETHTISSGRGGWTRTQGMTPDALVVGKPIAGGLPCAVYGVTAALAERMAAAKRAAPPGHSGIGTTLSGNRLAIAAVRTTLEHLMTDAVYDGCIDRATTACKGLRGAIARHGFGWHVTQLGMRMEFQFCAEAPRNAAQARAAMHDDLEHYVHLYLLNRGVIITPFHNMLLISPSTSALDVSRLIKAFDQCLASIAA